MIKILLVSGHTSGYNKCSETGVNEGDLNIELVRLLYARLVNYADVQSYPYSKDMYRDNKEGDLAVNLTDYDYIFEVHFNAGKGSGCSIYLHEDYTGGVGVENNILNNLKKLGVKLRGKNGFNRTSTLLNCNTAHKLNIDYALIETLFYDNTYDMEWYTLHKEDVADAVANGIIDGFGLKQIEAVPTENIRYRVQVGSFSNRENAERLSDSLKDKGYDNFIVTVSI